MASSTSTTSASVTSERVSYAEAYARFAALESPSAELNARAFQDELTTTLALLRQSVAQRQRDSVLSPNERFFELNNTQLYAFCLEHLLAMLIPKQTFFQQPGDAPEQLTQQHRQPPPPDARESTSSRTNTSTTGANDQLRNVLSRIRFLREADVFHTQFLDRSEQLGVLQPTKRREQYERLDAKQFALARDEKVQRFQLQREMERKLAEVQRRKQQLGGKAPGQALTGDDEDGLELDDDVDELEREQLLAFIQLAVVKSMDEQLAINQVRLFGLVVTDWSANVGLVGHRSVRCSRPWSG